MVDQQQAGPAEKEARPNIQEQFLQYFLRRLEQMEQTKRSGAAEGADPITARVLDRAIFSTWLDCVELGGKEEAEQVIRRYAADEGPRELSGSSSSI